MTPLFRVGTLTHVAATFWSFSTIAARPRQASSLACPLTKIDPPTTAIIIQSM
jgi:hypothetical protein